MQRNANAASWQRELERTERELDKAIQAILDGVPCAQLKDKIGSLEDRKAELQRMLASASASVPLLHPNMALIYQRPISELHHSLSDEQLKQEAFEVLRSLVSEVRLVPEGKELAIVLQGDLAAMLSFAAGKEKPDLLADAGLSQSTLVAGAGFEPATFRL